MTIKQLATFAILATFGLNPFCLAETVEWEIDSSQSWIRLTIPDQNIVIGEDDDNNPIEIPAALRGAQLVFDVTPSFPSNPPVVPWTDDRGRRAPIQGTLSTDYVEGSSISFTAGAHDASLVELGSWIPNRNFWNGSDFDFHKPEEDGYGAAFASELTLAGFFRVGHVTLYNVEIDADGTATLSGSGPWTQSGGTVTSGGKSGSNLDFWAQALAPSARTTNGATTGPNSGSITIEDMGGNQRKMTIELDIPFELDISGLPLEDSTFTGEIVAYATLSSATPPSLVASAPYHTGFPGGTWAPVDSVKQLVVRSGSSQLMGLANLTSSSKGINGVVLDFEDLEALEDISLEYTWSPQGAFVEGSNPVTGWGSATAPTSTTFHAGEGVGGSNRVRIQWANGAIINRYLRIKVIHDEATIAELYLGNVVGKVTAPSGGLFSVGNADVSAIRVGVGTNVNAGSMLDIDKNSFVNNTDISTMRPGIGVLQLRQITVPAL